MKFSVLLFSFILFTNVSHAKVTCGSGVTFSKKLTINVNKTKKDIFLNGVGLKKVLVFNIFYAALYLENPTTSASQILNSKEIKIGAVHALRDISKDQLVDQWDKEYERLCGQNCQKLMPFHEKFLSYARNVKNGERLYLIMFSDRFEFEISGSKGQETFPPIRSAEYGRILQRVLIGADAEDKSLENGLLGKQSICKS